MLGIREARLQGGLRLAQPAHQVGSYVGGGVGAASRAAEGETGARGERTPEPRPTCHMLVLHGSGAKWLPAGGNCDLVFLISDCTCADTVYKQGVHASLTVRLSVRLTVKDTGRHGLDDQVVVFAPPIRNVLLRITSDNLTSQLDKLGNRLPNLVLQFIRILPCHGHQCTATHHGNRACFGLDARVSCSECDSHCRASCVST